MINFKRNELPFPVYSLSLTGLFVATEAAIVRLGANEKKKFGPV
jgi:hypothetical protein